MSQLKAIEKAARVQTVEGQTLDQNLEVSREQASFAVEVRVVVDTADPLQIKCVLMRANGHLLSDMFDEATSFSTTMATCKILHLATPTADQVGPHRFLLSVHLVRPGDGAAVADPHGGIAIALVD